MKRKISILGCGWLGMALALHLTEKGNKIKGSTTTQAKLNALASNGVEPFLIDISNNTIDISGFSSADVLVVAIASKNIKGFKRLISEIEKSAIRKVLFVSSTSVYPNTNYTVTEKTCTTDSPLAEIEKLFFSSTKFETTIVRFGGLFGYDRKPGNFFKQNKVIPNPEGVVNLIHRDDCIQIIEQIIIQNRWNNIFNACADTHPSRREFYLKEVAKIRKVDIAFDEQSENTYKRISSQKLKDTLGYEFKYADLMYY